MIKLYLFSLNNICGFESYVAIYDGTRWSAERDTIFQLTEEQEQFYFLDEGMRYDMRNRQVVE